MAGSGVAGFWSYVHADNEAGEGQILRLADKVRAAYGLLSGEDLEIFIDRDLNWGDEWASRIDGALLSATFFIPIITPRFFQSTACREELLKFRAEADRAGLERLLLPVYWVKVPELERPDGPDDEAMALVAERQREDLREVRLSDENSAPYKAAVDRLASSLLEIVASIDAKSAASVVADFGDAGLREGPGGDRQGCDEHSGHQDGDEPGLLELLAEGEEAMPRLSQALERLSELIEEVGKIAQAGSEDMRKADARGAGFAGRLRTSEQVAAALDGPAAEIAAVGHSYAADLVRVDPAILTLIDLASEAGPEEAADVAEFVSTVLSAADAASSSLAELEELVRSLDDTARLSRAFRRPAKTMKAGLLGILDGRSVIEQWARKIEELGLEPPDEPSDDESGEN